MARYDHAAIEAQAQKRWEDEKIYELDLSKENANPYYLLFEFPYPSGDLHLGHWYAYALTDIYARFLRAKGKDVLFPIGFDAFGLPAENAAMRNGANPREWTYANMDRMRAQIKSMGTAVDWSKEVVTCDPSYYRWTQWLFLKLFEHQLAERKQAPVKWCPKDKTVLANEQVIDGACERCGSAVEEKNLTQWFLKITTYAERLLKELETLPWREDIKEAQRAWIGKSTGATLTFPITASSHSDTLSQTSVSVFTTRPDTLYGVTYIVLAPEHSLVKTLLPHVQNEKEVTSYVEETKRKTERERSEHKEKTGVRLEGLMATNPATHEPIPVYVADYVLGSYGTGAVMAVPAHDERDFEFAKKQGLPITQVVAPRCIDYTNPHQDGKKLVPRDAIIGVVYNPKSNTYLTLSWPAQGWTTFVSGGRDEGEDAVACAKREIEEETGYTDLALIRVLGETQSEFFAAHKHENRVARNTVVYFELTSDAQVPVSQKELKQHHVVWSTKEDVLAKGLQHAEFDFIWERLEEEKAYTGSGVLVNSGTFTGRDSTEAMADIVLTVGGESTTNYRIRDWLVSRQRYWGCPIPIVYDPEGVPHAVPAEHLPWLLPTDVTFGEGEQSPLATSKELRERVVSIFGEGWTPECDTLDTFVDSSWYYLRYLHPHGEHEFSSASRMKTWLPVERYSGGSEHTTMHLLYARFFHKALYDLALVPTSEPFKERFNRGLILGPDGAKMSKSKGNVINPDDMVKKYGADAVRSYLAFIGPYNEPGHYPFNLEGIGSMRKFLERIASLGERTSDTEPDEAMLRALASCEHKVSEDTDRFKFNTALSSLMVLVRFMEHAPVLSRAAYGDLVRMIAPFAPHLAEMLWQQAGKSQSVHTSSWPSYDKALLVSDEATITVQVNGKKRGELTLAKEASEADALTEASKLATVASALGGQAPERIIYVPGRILNLVVKAPQ